ncbi:Secreted protein [Tumidithrix helvetica PCC 7403]|uniref:hypothetical protein n=1 Tax=Tumidithrix helvetica TaxID=3457545 RepID=UPI003CB8BD7D
MKTFQLIFVSLFVLLNLAIASPSLADRIPYTENPDYIQIVNSLTELQKVKETEATPSEETAQKITALEFQKYALETGVNWGQCQNETGKPLGVYGSKRKKLKSNRPINLYFLADGQTTKPEWDCDGIYIPSDAKVSDLEVTAPAVAKIVDGTKLIVKANPETGAIAFNTPVSLVKSEETTWFIPNVSQSEIDARVPNAPTEGND